MGDNAIHFNTAEKGRIPLLVVDYLLREGRFSPSRVPKAKLLGRRKGYKVDPKIRLEMFQKLGVDPTWVHIDLFASPDDAQERLFLTEQNSAWYYNWSKFCQEPMILWVNPPFGDIGKVLVKACLEPCRMVLISPVWIRNWTKMLG